MRGGFPKESFYGAAFFSRTLLFTKMFDEPHRQAARGGGGMRTWRKLHSKILDSPDITPLSDGAIVLLTFLIAAQDDSGYYPWDDTSIRRLTVTRPSWSRDVYVTLQGELVACGIARLEDGGIVLVNGEKLNGLPRKDVDKELYPRNRDVYVTSTSRHIPVAQSRVEQSRAGEKKEPLSTEVRKSGAKAPFDLPEWVDKTLWDSFMEMRKSIKAKNNQHAMSLLIGELDKLRAAGNDPKVVIEQSIMNSWKGVFAVKKGANNGSSETNPLSPNYKPIKYTVPDGVGLGR